ncbi:hypothetical protein ARMGADRAFT_925675 [Armillaria gallica]|uniref:Integrase core domain-containing protein n=1 Tax=Armillaria gallica TaxID=47427 RepID=A0A2H3E2Z3_ARMGA|nr:hypothetical protein ARMGADRAFT_925675 [Armillaria gallica]
MLAHRGTGWGSYIFGRSVHNTRIERLWFDVTHDFGQKWKDFFLDLEVHYGLNPTNRHHLWLIHYLWLPSINQDAQDWMGMWNSHRMTLPRSSPRTPREMFRSSMIADGPRGIAELMARPIDDDVDDLNAFGIDWEVADDPTYMSHILEQNPEEWDEENPFSSAPPKPTHVPVEPPECPFNTESLEILSSTLADRVDLSDRRMEMRWVVWEEAISLCDYLLRTQNAGSEDVQF